KICTCVLILRKALMFMVRYIGATTELFFPQMLLLINHHPFDEVVPGLTLLLCLALVLMGCVIRKKRRMEGMYRPSAEESKQTGPRGAERPGLPLPKEERLI
uniref:Crumbs homolog 3b n=1 Tax=Oncorhynchus mykiss TaxID=8022 RepID=A0A8C7NQU4_ONCMY